MMSTKAIRSKVCQKHKKNFNDHKGKIHNSVILKKVRQYHCKETSIRNTSGVVIGSKIPCISMKLFRGKKRHPNTEQFFRGTFL